MALGQLDRGSNPTEGFEPTPCMARSLREDARTPVQDGVAFLKGHAP